MTQEINTNIQDSATSGTAIYKGSLSGRKTQLVQQTGQATGTIVVVAGGSSTLTFDLALWPADLATAARNATNIVSRSTSVAWALEAIYVDTASLDPTAQLGASTLTAGQRKITMAKVCQIYPAYYSGTTRYTQETSYLFFNNDASDHTLYFYGLYNYIMFGDANL